tara:strand:- start:18 stop:572 length:555 start_codon:yes stop_codon:yes gene_type:complete
MTISKIQAESMNLADTYAFSGSVSGAGKITHIDQWRLTSNFTGDVDPLTANLERVDTNGGALLGSAMTQSSGVFTFPVTGLWQITFFGYHSSSANNNDAKIILKIKSTINGSDFYDASGTASNTHGTGGAARGSSTTTFIKDVANVSTHKVKFSVDALDGSNTTTFGSTNDTATGITFIRLGDT